MARVTTRAPVVRGVPNPDRHDASSSLSFPPPPFLPLPLFNGVQGYHPWKMFELKMLAGEF